MQFLATKATLLAPTGVVYLNILLFIYLLAFMIFTTFIQPKFIGSCIVIILWFNNLNNPNIGQNFGAALYCRRRELGPKFFDFFLPN